MIISLICICLILLSLISLCVSRFKLMWFAVLFIAISFGLAITSVPTKTTITKQVLTTTIKPQVTYPNNQAAIKIKAADKNGQLKSYKLFFDDESLKIKETNNESIKYQLTYYEKTNYNIQNEVINSDINVKKAILITPKDMMLKIQKTN